LTSAGVRAQVAEARGRQQSRQGKPNARLTPREIESHCVPDAAGASLLAQAMARLSLSARAYHRILKVARTIADLDGADAIGAPQVAEAVGYRRFDRI
jgi:magnesium chelatase family protein